MEQWCFDSEMQRKAHCIIKVIHKLMIDNHIT